MGANDKDKCQSLGFTCHYPATKPLLKSPEQATKDHQKSEESIQKEKLTQIKQRKSIQNKEKSLYRKQKTAKTNTNNILEREKSMKEEQVFILFHLLIFLKAGKCKNPGAWTGTGVKTHSREQPNICSCNKPPDASQNLLYLPMWQILRVPAIFTFASPNAHERSNLS